MMMSVVWRRPHTAADVDHNCKSRSLLHHRPFRALSALPKHPEVSTASSMAITRPRGGEDEKGEEGGRGSGERPHRGSPAALIPPDFSRTDRPTGLHNAIVTQTRLIPLLAAHHPLQFSPRFSSRGGCFGTGVEGRYHPLISNVAKRTETSSNIRRPRRRGGREGKKEGRKGADRIKTAVPEVWTSARKAALCILGDEDGPGRIVPNRCCWWKEMCKPMDCGMDGVGGGYTSSAAVLEMGEHGARRSQLQVHEGPWVLWWNSIS
jgi:hypothetical protein